MLGWHVSVYRQKDGGAAPATAGTEGGTRLAVWQTGVGGLDWLVEMEKDGKAVGLGGNGYPCWFTAPAEHLLPRILSGPPSAKDEWLIGDQGIVDPNVWVGKTQVNREAAGQCRADEWLLVEAWDES
jgi:hypothetical protein